MYALKRNSIHATPITQYTGKVGHDWFTRRLVASTVPNTVGGNFKQSFRIMLLIPVMFDKINTFVTRASMGLLAELAIWRVYPWLPVFHNPCFYKQIVFCSINVMDVGRMCIKVLWRINAFILIIFSVNRDTNRMDFAPKFRIREFSYWFEPTRMPFWVSTPNR